VLNRAFRQSLLCHAGVPARPDPSPEAIPALRLTAMARPDSATPDLVSAAPESFHTMDDQHVTLSLPRMKAAVVALFDRWPLSAGFEELRRESLARLGQGDGEAGADSDRREFAELVLQGMASTLIEPHVHEPRVASEPGERPRTTPLARRQAATGVKVVNLRNGIAVLRDLDRLIVPMLDGTRDRATVVAELSALFLRGDLCLRRDGQPVTNPATLRVLLDEQVGETFGRLVGEALLLDG
jgi:methyltransferase-like protein